MQCNIDAAGKRFRLIAGIVTLLIAGAVALWSVITGANWLAWVIVAGLSFAGGFSVFEARAGWCAVRAIGFKTPV